MTPLRFLDIALVLATAPFVALAGLPALGYLLGGGSWVVTRLATEWLERRAGDDPRARVGWQVAGMMARVWIVLCAVVAARVAGGRDDGIMAAAVALAAFTVYFAMSMLVRQLERNVVRP
jgi:quinol-cytochrome oxidoreductase complex cytochrome b subunit